MLSATDARIKILLDENRTHDFRTSRRCAGYLLDHSGDEEGKFGIIMSQLRKSSLDALKFKYSPA